MRIAQIVTRADETGGAQVHVRDLSEALLASGHEVVVLAGGQGSFSAELTARGIPHRHIPHLAVPLAPGKDFLALCEIVRELRRVQPDIVAAHSAKAGLLGRIAAAALGYPAVFTPHGWSIGDRISRSKGIFFRYIERAASAFSSRIVNVCNYEVDLAVSTGVAKAPKLVMVHNGLPDVDDDLRANPSTDPPRLVMVARMAEPKDHATLLSALSRLQYLPWTLELVGGGPLEATLKQQAVELGISDRVDFLGHIADPSARLRSAQIFVLASRSEAFPYSILEAMRAGLPVIASRVGGIPEAVEHGGNGLLTPPRDVDALERVLSQVLSAPTLRKKLGDNGRRRFLASFTFDQMFAKTMLIYQQALSAHPYPVPGATSIPVAQSSRSRVG
jgi:glycosyltransferase involved in cell wall biosynthesis